MVNSSLDRHLKTVGGGHIRFTDDYGATWTAADKTLSGGDVTGSNTDGEPYLFKAPNGNLILMLGRCWVWDRPAAEGTWQTTSTDGGETWSAAAQVSVSGLAGDQDFMALLDESFIYDGVIYLSGRISTAADETNCKSILVKSIDNGANWVYVSDISSAGISNEVGIEYQDNGDIIAIMRGNNDANLPYRALSTDMGESWYTVGPVEGMLHRSGKHRVYTKTRLEGGANWWTDRKLIMCGFEVANALRCNSIWLSKDGGYSWTPPRGVEEWYEDAGYGDLFYNPTLGQYVFMCYRGGSNTSADVIQYNFTINW